MDLAVTGPFASSLDDDKAKQRACAQETRKEMIKNTKPLLCSYHLIYYVLGLGPIPIPSWGLGLIYGDVWPGIGRALYVCGIGMWE